MPLIMPEPRYFSMPSSVVGGLALRKPALNCRPWVRSLIQLPLICTHSPAAMLAAWPTTVTRSRCPRTLTRRTQKPVSELWNVTRSTSPDRGSLSLASVGWDFATTVTSLPCWSCRRTLADVHGCFFAGDPHQSCRQPVLLVFARSFSQPNTERPSREADRLLSVVINASKEQPPT